MDMTSIRFQRGHVKKLLLLPSFLPSRYRLHLSQIQREGQIDLILFERTRERKTVNREARERAMSMSVDTDTFGCPRVR